MDGARMTFPIHQEVPASGNCLAPTDLILTADRIGQKVEGIADHMLEHNWVPKQLNLILKSGHRQFDQNTYPILAGGLVILGAQLVIVAVLASTVAAFVVIGLIGVILNPTLVARGMRTALRIPTKSPGHSDFMSPIIPG